MTGFGEAHFRDETLAVQVEIRTVNNRYLKINTKAPDAYASLEGEIERFVREKVSRGSVNVSIRIEHLGQAGAAPINEVLLTSLLQQLQQFAKAKKVYFQPELTNFLTVPGMITDDSRRQYDVEQEWPTIRNVLQEAIAGLHTFRADEGRSMQAELQSLGQLVGDRLTQVTELAPLVISEFRCKLFERIKQVLAEANVTASLNDLIREVAIYADRTDITEEITRLRCHLEQYEAFLAEPVSAGRKLDFLTQEMNREVNTIGSKGNNVPIAHCVVDMKAAVEKIREILQNVE